MVATDLSVPPRINHDHASTAMLHDDTAVDCLLFDSALRMSALEASMGLQQYIVQATAKSIHQPMSLYHPLALPSSNTQASLSKFGLTNRGIKMFLFITALGAGDESALVESPAAVTKLLAAATNRSPLFSQCACIPESGTVPPTPLFVLRWFTQCLDACVAWRSTDCLASLHNVPLDPDWSFLKFTDSRHTFCGVWEDWVAPGVDSLPRFSGPTWVFVTTGNLVEASTHLPTLQPIMSFRVKKIEFFVLASVDSFNKAPAHTQHRLRCFSKHMGGTLHLPLPSTSRFTPLLCLSLTQMMHNHLANKKIGA